MHEFIFAKSLLKEIEETKIADEEIDSIELELGELVGIESRELIEALENLTSWKYNISIKPSLIKCRCSYEGRAKIEERLHDLVVFSCPNCSDTPKAIEGDKIKITKINYK
ncbi:hydrogenase maturation nickel metallochaperone HypA [Candidatus Pacearchaeota archaeon]|nr:hydrogenase maturation nickel metallochaperone HypA [Candidatus Pacearchaeota archaeon]